MEVYISDIKFSVIINRKKIKNIYFRFDDSFNLVVNANKYISDKEILKLIEKNSKSLINMYNKMKVKRKKNKEFWYLGKKYDIIFDEKLNSVLIDDFIIYSKNEIMLDKFIKNKTIDIFSKEVANLKKIIETPDFKLKIRKMKTRWGVCNYKLNIITLNSELIRYNLENLRYVIIHEMCHFYHHDHSKNFWGMVSKYYPDYKKARKELKY